MRQGEEKNGSKQETGRILLERLLTSSVPARATDVVQTDESGAAEVVEARPARLAAVGALVY